MKLRLHFFNALLGIAVGSTQLLRAGRNDTLENAAQPKSGPHWPQYVDYAEYRSVDNPDHTNDVTKTLNRMIAKYSLLDFTLGRSLSEVFGDPNDDAWMMLRVTRGNCTVDIYENDLSGGPDGFSYDLSELA